MRCAAGAVLPTDMAPRTQKRTVTDGAAAPSSRKRRAVLDDKPAISTNYFASSDDKPHSYVRSGARVLDCTIGGGYVLGRVVNLVGDKSTGKTLLAIEACANFIRDYPNGKIQYAEAEAAFDQQYAEALGMPLASVKFSDSLNTVEDWYEDLDKFLKGLDGKPGLYILDSLDALSDEAEQGRGMGDSSYGGSKPKKIGELFRRLVQEIEKSKCLVIIISQIRDKLNVTFGETKTRSGGRALDFYASQVIWLAEVEKLKRTIDKVDRVTGIKVRANVKKNKVGLPFRQCTFPLLFGYGIDDLTAAVEWLIEVHRDERLKEAGLSVAGYKVRLNNLRDKGGEEVRDLRSILGRIVEEEWARIETSFLPKSSKY